MVAPYIIDNVVHPITDDWGAVVKIFEPNTVPPTPLNLTNWEVYLVITKDLAWSDDDAYIYETFTPTLPASGEVVLFIPAEKFSDPGHYFRGIKVKSPFGVRTTIVSGTFELVAAGPKTL